MVKQNVPVLDVSHDDFVRKRRAAESLEGLEKYAQHYANEMQKEYSTGGWSGYEQKYNRFNKMADDFMSVAGLWKSQYAGNQEIVNYISGLEGLVSRARGVNISNRYILSKYQSEEDYNADLLKGKAYNDKWGHYAEAVDFADVAGYRNYGNPTTDDLREYDEATNTDLWEVTKSGGTDGLGNNLLWENGTLISPLQKNGKYEVRDPLGLYLNTSEEERKHVAAVNDKGRLSAALTEGVVEHWELLEEDEINMYYYLLGTQGLDTAKAYLDDTNEKRNARWGALEAQRIQNIDSGIGRAAAMGWHGVKTGLEQWGLGVTTAILGAGDAQETSPTQYASAEISNSLDGFGKYAYGATVTVGNMLPSILLSKMLGASGVGVKVAQGVGSFSMGLSAGGNAYGQAVKEGYDDGQARNYGLLVGVSEATLQTLIGGIGDLGGASTSKLLSKASMIDNALLRVSAKLGISIVDEITEEELQLFLEPAFKSIIFGEDYDAPTIDEMVETAIVTALSTGTLEGGSTITHDIAENRQLIDTGKAIIQKDGGVTGLAELANGIAGDSAAKVQKSINRQTDRVLKKTASGSTSNTTARKVGRLYDTVSTAITSQNRTDIAKSLSEKKDSESKALFSQKESQRIAKALTKESNGQELTKAEQKLLDRVADNAAVLETVESVLKNEKSTVGQRTAAQKNFIKQVNSKSFGTMNPETVKKVEEASKTYTVAEEKQTLYEGKAVQVKKIADSKDGQMMVELEDGRVVPAGAVSYATEGEATIMSAIASLGLPGEYSNLLLNPWKKNPDGVTAEDYALGMVDAVTYGSHNMDVSESKHAAKLTDLLRNNAYVVGQKWGKLATATQETKLQKARMAAKYKEADGKAKQPKKGAVYYGYEGKTIDQREVDDEHKELSKMQKVGVDFAQRLAESRGITIYFYESYMKDGERYYIDRDGNEVRAENGFYDPKDSSIHIDLNAGSYGRGTVLFTIAHELTHFIQDWSPKHYKKLCDILMKGYKSKGQSVRQLIEAQQKDAKLSGRELTWEQAYDEVIADSMESILADGRVMELMQDLEQADKTLAGKVKKFFKDMADLIKQTIDAYKGVKPDSTEGKLVMGMKDIYSQLQEVFSEGVYEGGENFKWAEKNTTNEGGEFRYSLNKNAKTELHKALYDRSYRSEVLLRDESPSIMLAQKGVANRPMAMKASHIRENVFTKEEAQKLGLPVNSSINYHGLGEDFFLQIIDSLDSVKEAYRGTKNADDSSRRENYFLLVSEFVDKDGNTINVPVYIDEHAQINRVFIEVNKISTVFGRENFREYINRQIRNKNLVRIKNRSNQASERSAPIAEGYGKDASNSSIRNPNGIVKENDSTDSDGTKASARKGENAAVLEVAYRENLTEGLTDGERDALRMFNEEYGKLKDLTQKKAEQTNILAELKKNGQEGSEEATKARNRIGTLERMIEESTKKLQKYESYDTVQKLAEKVRPAAEKVLIEERKKELERYGTIPKGEKAVRESALPVSTDGKNKVSRTARTVKEAGVTPDDFADLIDREVYLKDGMTYLPITNNETTRKATEWIERLGWTAALAEWHKDVGRGKTGADIVARGAILLNNAAQSGDKANWLEILFSYQQLGTKTAQGLQALRILKALAPNDKLHMIRRSVEQMVADMHLKTKIEIDKELLKRFEMAENDEVRDLILGLIQQNVADQLPASFIDKFTALRYLNMLGNPRTQVRNFFGNAMMKMVAGIKNTIAASLESIVYYGSGKKFQRTRSVWVDKGLLKAAKADYENVKPLLLDGGKYSKEKAESSEFAKQVMEKRRIFKSKFLEKYRTITNDVMDKGDLIFSKAAYSRALAGYLQAKGVTDIAKADEILLDEARVFAVKEAQEQTFRDTNWLSSWISKMGRRHDTPKIGYVLGDGVMPFRKTPANILIRAEEYSPLGIINSVVTSIRAMGKNSTVTGDQVINSWAKSLTGTGLFGIGMLLSSLGLLKGGPDDDDELDKFESLYGEQNYAITLPDGTNFTFDWASPAAIPMLMGAQFMELIIEDGFQLSDLEHALTSLLEPMVELSSLQGIKDSLDNVQFAENNLGQMVIIAGLNYLTQGMTNSWMGQTERTFQDSRQMTYVDKDSAIPAWIQRTMGTTLSKVPGIDYNQIPYINAWGEEEENPNVGLNAVYNMISPSYFDKTEKDAVYDELVRLNDVQDENVFPETPEKTITYTDKDGNEHEDYGLSAEEYVELAKTQGQKQRKLVETLIENKEYEKLPDEYKAKAIRFAYKYAKEYARIEVLDAKGYSAKWMQEIKGDVPTAIIQHVKDQYVKDQKKK